MPDHDAEERIARIHEALTAVKIVIEQEMEEQREGAEMVKGMLLRENPELDEGRIKYADFVVFLDDARKPICQLDYHGDEKIFVLFVVPKKFTDLCNWDGRFVEVTGNSDLYEYKDELMQVLDGYLDGGFDDVVSSIVEGG